DQRGQARAAAVDPRCPPGPAGARGRRDRRADGAPVRLAAEPRWRQRNQADQRRLPPPPVHVEAAMTELSLGKEWTGKGNRENQTLPVLHLRESAANMGLLRKRRGMLMLTSRARGLRADPVALWWHL